MAPQFIRRCTHGFVLGTVCAAVVTHVLSGAPWGRLSEPAGSWQAAELDTQDAAAAIDDVCAAHLSAWTRAGGHTAGPAYDAYVRCQALAARAHQSRSRQYEVDWTKLRTLQCKEGETLGIPPGVHVMRAFYGDPASVWDTSKGAMVTVNAGTFVSCSNSELGDPLPGYPKVLVVEITGAAPNPKHQCAGRLLGWSASLEDTILWSGPTGPASACAQRCNTNTSCALWEWCSCKPRPGCSGCYLFSGAHTTWEWVPNTDGGVGALRGQDCDFSQGQGPCTSAGEGRHGQPQAARGISPTHTPQSDVTTATPATEELNTSVAVDTTPNPALCPESQQLRCETCQPGDPVDGGLRLQGGLCVGFCSQHGFCGTGPAYRQGSGTTNCLHCRPPAAGYAKQLTQGT
jgi:hypothetical protein